MRTSASKERGTMSRLVFMIGLSICISLFIGSGAAYAAATHYVNDDATGADNGTSWQDAFTDLQSALDVAVAGDEIWVAAGTYKPSLSIDGSSNTRTASFSLKSGVALYGGFAGGEMKLEKRTLDPTLTVLSGDIGTAGDDTDNCYHVVYASGVTDAVLDGFTVTGGRGDASGRDSQGAGMYNYESCLTVSNCIFSDNRVARNDIYHWGHYGGAMYNYNSSPTVTNCTFSGNQAGKPGGWAGQGGAMYNYGSYNYQSFPRVTGCTFTNNEAFVGQDIQPGGGAMYNYHSSPTVDSCTFAGNSGKNGGAMYNFEGYATVTNCIFNANSTNHSDGRGGAIYNMGLSTILNCTFYRNGWRWVRVSYSPESWDFRPYPAEGGAICDVRLGSFITNCIFSENAARWQGGALMSHAYSRYKTELTNCLFYGNIRWDWLHEGPVSSHAFADGEFKESNNLYDVDPLLVDPAGGDFNLPYTSPCIDAGYNDKQGNYSWPALPATDFDGDKRIVDGDGDGIPAVDIGAHEYIPNVPDLGAFIEALAESGELDGTLASRLIAYVNNAQAALAQDELEAAISSLNDLIADVRKSLGKADETALLIEAKTLAVIGEI